MRRNRQRLFGYLCGLLLAAYIASGQTTPAHITPGQTMPAQTTSPQTTSGQTARSNPRGWCRLGRSQLYRRQFDQARTSAQHAIQLDEKFPDAYRLLGEAAFELSDYDGAYRAWLTANRLNPSDSQTNYFLGRLFYEANAFNEAAAWFRETLKLAPAHFSAMTYLGLSAEGMGFDETAEQLYRRAIQESKSQAKPFAWAFLSLAKLRRRHGSDSEALSLLEEGEKTCPEPHLLTSLGQMLTAAGRNERAEAILRRAIQMDTTIAEAHYSLSRLLRSAGKIDEANVEIEQFHKAKRSEPQNKVLAIRK